MDNGGSRRNFSNDGVKLNQFNGAWNRYGDEVINQSQLAQSSGKRGKTHKVKSAGKHVAGKKCGKTCNRQKERENL